MADFDEKLNSILSNPDAMAQIMQMAQALSGGEAVPTSCPPPPKPQGFEPTQSPFQMNQPQTPDLLSSLTGGIDPKLLTNLLPLIQELGGQQNSNSRQLLYALRPYLKPERQDKVERAIQLARLFHLGKKFLAGWEG